MKKINLKLKKGYWIEISLMIGTIVGAITDNIGIWIPVGIAIGAALETTYNK